MSTPWQRMRSSYVDSTNRSSAFVHIFHSLVEAGEWEKSSKGGKLRLGTADAGYGDETPGLVAKLTKVALREMEELYEEDKDDDDDEDLYEDCEGMDADEHRDHHERLRAMQARRQQRAAARSLEAESYARVACIHLACSEQLIDATGQISREQLKAARMRETLERGEVEVARREAAAAGKVEQAKKELAGEREKRLQMREERDVAVAQAKATEAELKEQLRSAEADVARFQESTSTFSGSKEANAEINRLRTELRSALATITRLSPLQNELKKSFNRLQPAKHEIHKLERALHALEKQHEEAQRQLKIHENEGFLLREAAESEAKAEVAGMVSALRQEVQQGQNDLQSARNECSLHERAVEDLNAQLASTNDTLLVKSKEVNELRTDVEILQAQITTHTAKVAASVEVAARHSATAKKLAEVEMKYQALMGQLEDAEETIDLTRNDVDEWQKRAIALETELRNTQFPKAGRKRKGAAPSPPSSTTNDDAVPIEVEIIAQLRSTIEDLRSKLDEEKQQLALALSAHEEKLKEFEEEKLTLAEAGERAQAEATQLEMQRKGSTALITVLRTKLSESEANVAKLQSGLGACKEMMLRYGSERESAISRVTSLEQTLTEVQEQKEALARSIEEHQCPPTQVETDEKLAYPWHGLASPPQSPPQTRHNTRQLDIAETSDSEGIHGSILFTGENGTNASHRQLLDSVRRLNAQMGELQRTSAETIAALLERMPEEEGAPESVEAA